MPEIGASLREARMRERIDITEVETATKIRAKYLRALENEEWDLLPGPTYVKTFLKTYGDYLGLDSKVLVDEYKQRFERPSPQDLMPFGPALGARRQRRVAPIVPPWFVVAVIVAALLGILFYLGSGGEDPTAGQPNVVITPTPTPTATPTRTAGQTTRRPATARRVDLRISATAVVNVCLVDATGKRVLDSVDLRPGASRRFRSSRFRVSFGNGAARMRVGGKTYEVPDRPDPIGFEVRPGRRPRELPASQRPRCT
jgi:cytoskeletal protein RodZ